MQIIVHATGLQLTIAMKAMAVEKFSRLRRMIMRFDHSDLLMSVELSRTTHHHHKGKIFRAEMHLPLAHKQSAYAAVEADDLYEAMDLCIGAAKRQLLKFKEKTA